MSQLDNFRQALKKNNAETDANIGSADKQMNLKNEDSAHMHKIEGANDGKKTAIAQPKMKRTSIGLPGELHEKLKIVCLWMKKEGIKDNPGLVDVVNELLSFYLEKHPSAEKLIQLFYNSK